MPAPARDAGSCPHGRPLSCFDRHDADDPARRRAAVPRVLRLPRRGAVERPRARACGSGRRSASTARWPGPAGLERRSCARSARLSYIKVVEFQRRGLVHLHVVLRADGGGRAGRAAAAVARRRRARPAPSREAVAELGVAVPDVPRTRRCAGPAGAPSIDVRVLDRRRRRRRRRPSPPTWPSTPPRRPTARAWLAHPIRSRAQLERLGAPAPHRRAWCARPGRSGAGGSSARSRLRDHAHTLGYAGQFSSKSVRYSTTFGALRAGPGRLRPRDASRTTSTTTASGATPAGATLDPRPTELARALLEAARGVPHRVPQPVPEWFPNAMTRENAPEEISTREPDRERFEEPVREGRSGAMAP